MKGTNTKGFFFSLYNLKMCFCSPEDYPSVPILLICLFCSNGLLAGS